MTSLKAAWIEFRLLISDKLMYWSFYVRGRHTTEAEVRAYLEFQRALGAALRLHRASLQKAAAIERLDKSTLMGPPTDF